MLFFVVMAWKHHTDILCCSMWFVTMMCYLSADMAAAIMACAKWLFLAV